MDGEEGVGEKERRCRGELESVLRDVNRSAVEAEREKRRVEAERQVQVQVPMRSLHECTQSRHRVTQHSIEY